MAKVAELKTGNLTGRGVVGYQSARSENWEPRGKKGGVSGNKGNFYNPKNRAKKKRAKVALNPGTTGGFSNEKPGRKGCQHGLKTPFYWGKSHRGDNGGVSEK